MANIVEFKNVTFEYDANKEILNDLSFCVKEGKYSVLLGHNGSVKSTIAKLIMGLLEAKKGEIFIFDLLVQQLKMILLLV